jgi:hypothetical protein
VEGDEDQVVLVVAEAAALAGQHADDAGRGAAACTLIVGRVAADPGRRTAVLARTSAPRSPGGGFGHTTLERMSPIDHQQEQRQRERLHHLVDRLTDDQLATSLGGGWTVGVALAHLAFWDRRVVAQLEQWQRQGRGPEARDQLDSEVVNSAALPLWQALPPRAAAQAALEAAEAADRALAQADPRLLEQVLARESPFTLPRAVHRAEHLDQIERGLAP